MYLKAVRYNHSKRGVIWLAPNSQAYTLFQERKVKELDQLISEVWARADAMEGSVATSKGKG